MFSKPLTLLGLLLAASLLSACNSDCTDASCTVAASEGSGGTTEGGNTGGGTSGGGNTGGGSGGGTGGSSGGGTGGGSGGVSPTAPVDTTKLPIVYAWAQRSASANFKGIDVMLDNYDALPDTSQIMGGFQKSNIVDRASDGTETTVFDCINNQLVHCAALDPKVSPDNKKIAFTVLFAKVLLETRWTLFGDMPIKLLGDPDSAVIYIYDTETRALTAWPRVSGVMDMHPDWISNDKLVFVSTRAKHYPVRMYQLSTPYPTSYALQRWTANLDGTNAVNIGPHDDMALHPLVLSDGNILTSTWRVDEHLSEGLTPANQYWMTMTDQFGGDEVSVYGAHIKMFSEAGSGHWDEQVALHFFGERSNGDLMTANYYRGNNLGLGMPIAFPRLPHGVEGVGNTFQPAVYRLLPWAQEQDEMSYRDSTGAFMGKAGYPAGLPGGEVMLTLGKGACYTALPTTSANAAFFNGPGCDAGIYVQKTFPSKHPNDLSKIVDRPDRHEFAARVRLPYSAIYGKAAPAVQTREDLGVCSLRVVNARTGKLVTGGAKCGKEGACIEPGYTIASIQKLAIYEAKPNLTPETALNTTSLEGHEMRLLGYVRPESDGSVNVRIPCDTSYKLRGVAADGVEFIRDQVKHSNRPGEARHCQGCHAGHTESDRMPNVRGAFAATIAGKKAPASLSPN